MKSPQSDLPSYVSSGRIGARGFLVLLCAGPLSAALVGGLYLWARGETGSFVAIVLCDLFFLVLMVVVAYALFLGARSRSSRFNRFAAGAWMVLLLLPWWWVAVSGRLAGIETPSILHHYAELVPTLLLLGLEAIFLGLGPVYLAGEIANEPFSEATGRWADKDFSLEMLWPGGDPDALRQHLRAHGATPLLELQPVAGHTVGMLASGWTTLRIEGRKVESDSAARWITLALVDNRRSSDGRIRSTESELASSWAVSAEDYEALRECAGTTRDARTESPPVADAPMPLELQAAAAALAAGNYTAALAMARPHCQHPDAAVRNDAYRLSALCLSRLECWHEAFESYYALFEHEPGAFNALQLASTSVMAGELLRGQAWFEKADALNSAEHAMAPVELRTTILSALGQAGAHEACLPHLQWMAGMYQAFQTTDSHLLWMHRVPPFGEFLEKSHAILVAIMAPSQCAEWYRQNANSLPPEWQAMLNDHLGRFPSPAAP
ncbi:hypothetical protein [Luteimonas sp. A501]